MTHPQYGKPETWPRVPNRDRTEPVDSHILRRRGLCWFVVRKTSFGDGWGYITQDVAGPFWRCRSAEKRIDELEDRP